MQILTDAGADLTPIQTAGLVFHTVPLTFTLDGKSYRSGIDIGPEAFYDLLASTHSFPTTSQPAPGEFADAYRRLIANGDHDILSIHISSGLSGTLNAARLGAQQVPEAQRDLRGHPHPLRRGGLGGGGGRPDEPGGLAAGAHPPDPGAHQQGHRDALHVGDAQIPGARRPDQPHPGAPGANPRPEADHRRRKGTRQVRHPLPRAFRQDAPC